jgi:anaerobic selenocysteine-containing dehydrogenase
MRADGQFNPTIYNKDDRFRGVQGGRYVIFINPDDMAELELRQDDLVTLSSIPVRISRTFRSNISNPRKFRFRRYDSARRWRHWLGTKPTSAD